MAATIYDFSAASSTANGTTAGDNVGENATPPSSVNNAIRNGKYLLALLLDDLGAVNTVGGTATAITVTAAEGWTAYGTAAGQIPNGTLLSIKAPNAATGAATINVNSIGAKAIRRQGDTAIQSGDWLANSTLLLRYDTAYNTAAGAWVLVNGVTPTGSASLSGSALALSSTSLSANLTVTVIDAGAADNIALDLYRDSASPAAADILSSAYFTGRNSVAAKVNYATVTAGINSPTSGSERGSLFLRALDGASGLVNVVRVTATSAGNYSLDTSVSTTLGSSGNEFSGLRLKSGFDISWVGGPRIYASASEMDFVTAAQYYFDNDVYVSDFSLTGVTNGKLIKAGGGSYSSSRNTTASSSHFAVYNPNGLVGTISTSGTTTAYNTTSDETLKDFIGAYDPQEAIRIIKADPVREFHWKKSGEYAVGWGAQTSYAVSPDLASPGGWFDEKTGEPSEEGSEGAAYHPWGLDQGKRTPYLWAFAGWAVDRIQELEARLSQIEDELRGRKP